MNNNNLLKWLKRTLSISITSKERLLRRAVCFLSRIISLQHSLCFSPCLFASPSGNGCCWKHLFVVARFFLNILFSDVGVFDGRVLRKELLETFGSSNFVKKQVVCLCSSLVLMSQQELFYFDLIAVASSLCKKLSCHMQIEMPLKFRFFDCLTHSTAHTSSTLRCKKRCCCIRKFVHQTFSLILVLN